MPQAVNQGEPVVLVPTDPTVVLGLDALPPGNGAVEMAEKALVHMRPQGAKVTGIAAGTRPNGAKLVTVLTSEPVQEVVRKPDLR